MQKCVKNIIPIFNKWLFLAQLIFLIGNPNKVKVESNLSENL